MTRNDPEFAPIEAQDIVNALEPSIRNGDEKAEYALNGKDEKHTSLSSGSLDVYEVEEQLYDEHGKDKVLETAEDFSRALVSSEDDTNLPCHTFRMWLTGVGLAVFGAVLGMLFVS